MQWVLIFVVAGQVTAISGFDNDWACTAAAKKVMSGLDDKAQYWCVPTK